VETAVIAWRGISLWHKLCIDGAPRTAKKLSIEKLLYGLYKALTHKYNRGELNHLLVLFLR
jgi:hypothetical protein